MQNNSSFIVSGIIAFSIYFFICFLVMFYIFTPNKDAINITPNSTTIELDMIEEVAEKKMVERKVEKIIKQEEVVEKSTSASNEKKPDLKSLFANVKETAPKVVKEEVNNIEKSIDPKRFKSKFEKEKKSSNIKIDKLLEDEKTTTDSKVKSSAKGDANDDYGSKLYEILQAGAPISYDTTIVARVIVMVDANGRFDYKFQSKSKDEAYNEALRSYLDTQKGVSYPIPPNGKGVRYSVDFKFEG
ncbi:TonB C-terminal domain-containing protein [Aliarcobacter lanthieri]|uniref:TonB C-terminal domain-containing protein n=1 Tax=Aliarcobacter lanthieri TaxID=1355374 RepID=UPI003AA81493